MALLPLFHARRMALALKAETTEGTAVAPAGSDANIMVQNVNFEVDLDQDPREPVSQDLSVYASIPGSRMAKVSFEAEVKGSGAAGTAPKLGLLLKLARFGETVNASTNVLYDPVAVGVITATAAFYAVPESGDNLKAMIRGCRVSSLRLTVDKPGKYARFNVELTGVYNGITDVAGIVVSGLDTTKPPSVLSAAFSVHSYTPRISKYTIDFGLSGVMRDDMNTAEGYVSYVSEEMNPTMTFDPEQVLVATHDFHGKMLSGAEAAFSTVIGAAAGNILTITGPKLQYTKIKPGVRSKIAIWNVDAAFNEDSANDRIRLAWT